MSLRLIQGLGPGPRGDAPRAVLIDGDRIAALDAAAVADAGDAERLDAGGRFATPGFIELQINGIGGHDFTTDPTSMWVVGRQLATHGVTAFLPTIITAPRGTVEVAIRAWNDGRTADGAIPLGLHVEGPYLAPARRGAHPAEFLRDPDLDEVAGWLSAGAVRMLTLAPERPGAIAAIDELRRAGRVASIGHTEADAAEAAAAIAAGARHATHLFNAMPPLGHRAPGAAGALLADERVTLGLIADSAHLDPLLLQLVHRLAPHRIALVSDAIAALGLPPGRHRLGSQTVTVADGAARLADGTLAGGTAGLDAGVRGFAAAVGTGAAAIEAVTEAPARLLGLEDRGRLVPGCRADIVLLDDDLSVHATFVGGTCVFDEVGRWA